MYVLELALTSVSLAVVVQKASRMCIIHSFVEYIHTCRLKRGVEEDIEEKLTSQYEENARLVLCRMISSEN